MSAFTQPPLALYVHMPWCVRKCPYCDFNSHAAPERIPQQQYIHSLLEDLEADLPSVGERSLVSIFFGGGTPSLFSPEAIDEFLAGVRERIRVAPSVEVTLEANPGTIERGRFAGYRGAGITRVSLGAQSFDDEQLRRLGRIHAADDVRRCVDELRAADLTNFNIDLMYALPQQRLEQALDDLRAAMELEPTHISHYQLTLEPGTVFFHRPPALPDADSAWDMQVECQQALALNGYEQYEISAYARRGFQCVHNRNYWLYGDYIGIGAGAHGKLTDAAGTIIRTVRQRQPREYLTHAGQRVVERRVLTTDELPLEFMLNALRLREGFDAAVFEARTGLPIDSIAPTLEEAAAKGLMERHETRWQPSELGRQFLNDLQAMFLPVDQEISRPQGSSAHASS